MNINEFVKELGEQVSKHAAQRKKPVFFLSMLMDNGPRIRSGKHECHCPITYLHNRLRGEDESPCHIHEFGKAAASLGLSDDDAEIIVSAADRNFLLGPEANTTARALRPQLLKACGIGSEKGAAP